MDVYAKPDLTKKVRYGRRQRQVEMEERGEREERIVDIYVTADDLDLDPDPAQQDAVQRSKAEEQHRGFDESRRNHSRAAAAACLGLLCLLLLAVIVALVVKYFELIKEKDNLHQILSSFDQLQTRFNNLTEQKGHLQSSFDQLLSRYHNLTEERDDLKRRICESHGFTFDGGLCYYISAELKNWEESRRYCTDKQSDLIVINSKEKQDIVGKAVGRLNLYLWLGLTYKKEEESWKWVDGTPLTTPTYWHPGEPNNPEENCVEFYNRGWNDMSCTTTIRCICERVIY